MGNKKKVKGKKIGDNGRIKDDKKKTNRRQLCPLPVCSNLASSYNKTNRKWETKGGQKKIKRKEIGDNCAHCLSAAIWHPVRTNNKWKAKGGQKTTTRLKRLSVS